VTGISGIDTVPVGMRLLDKSETSCEPTLDAILDTMLGTFGMLVGSSLTTDDTRLLISDVTTERILERPGSGSLVIPGAVGPVVILGMIPVPVGII